MILDFLAPIIQYFLCFEDTQDFVPSILIFQIIPLYHIASSHTPESNVDDHSLDGQEEALMRCLVLVLRLIDFALGMRSMIRATNTSPVWSVWSLGVHVRAALS